MKEQLKKRKGLPVTNPSQPGNEIYQPPLENDSRLPMAMTWVCQLRMCLWSQGGRLEVLQGGPAIIGKISMSGNDFSPFEAKKIKAENDHR